METKTPPWLAKEPPMLGARWARAYSSAALPFRLHLSGTLQSCRRLFAGVRNTHTGGPHPCSVLGTAVASPCQVGMCVQKALRLLSPAITVRSSQELQSQTKQGICSLFSLARVKGTETPGPPKVPDEAGAVGVRALALFSLAGRSQHKPGHLCDRRSSQSQKLCQAYKCRAKYMCSAAALLLKMPAQ